MLIFIEPLYSSLIISFVKNTIRTIDARLSIIQSYEKEMTIPQIALVLVNDVPKPQNINEQSELFLHLIKDPFFIRILNDKQAISQHKGEMIYKLPSREDNYSFFLSEDGLDNYRLDLTKYSLITLNIDVIKLIWLIVLLNSEYKFMY